MDIILFSTADWDNPFWTNKQHMAKTFEENGHRVIYIDSLGLRKATATAKDVKRIIKRLKSLFLPYFRVSPKIWRISPFVLPFHTNKMAIWFNKWFLYLSIRALAKYLEINEYIVWTYSPVTDQIVDLFKDKKCLVYHCVDDLRASPGIDAVMIERRENNLVKKSDFVFTTSQALHERLLPLNEKTFYFNNVCDYKHFAQAKEKIFDVPADLIAIKKPRILFIGALSDYKVDFELIDSIASEKLNWHWIMIGEIGEGEPNTKIDILFEHNNIHFLGPKNYKDLPAYIQHCEVAVIPARLNQYTESMFPMKFFEYLSAGKQVVTTDLLALHGYTEIYYNSKNKSEFIYNLEKIIHGDEVKNIEEITLICKQQTWQERYQQMMKHFQPFLNKENT